LRGVTGVRGPGVLGISAGHYGVQMGPFSLYAKASDALTPGPSPQGGRGGEISSKNSPPSPALGRGGVGG